MAEAFVASGAWISHLVLAESVWVLASVYGLDADRIATAVGMLLDHDRLVLQDGDVVKAALGSFRERPAAGLADCLIVEIARKAGHQPVGIFDKSMSRLKGASELMAGSESSAAEYRCPIPGCSKIFYGARGGWDTHVGSLKKHPDWHPDVSDSEERKRIFKQEHDDWFKKRPFPGSRATVSRHRRLRK